MSGAEVLRLAAHEGVPYCIYSEATGSRLLVRAVWRHDDELYGYEFAMNMTAPLDEPEIESIEGVVREKVARSLYARLDERYGT